jgi:hypothetical protein
MPKDGRSGVLRAVVFAFCLLHLAFLPAACAKAQAKASPDGPPLNVPAPPPRVLAPVEEPLAENPPTTPEPAPPPPRTAARPATPPPRRPPTTTATTPTPEPEVKPETPAAPATVTEAPAAPRPVPTQADVAADKKVRDVMRKWEADLKRVDYKKLSADGRAQYEASKRFNDQAEQALKDRNYAFAATLADKAAALATELLGR